MLNKNEEARYLRQLILPDFGLEAQEKLKKSTVFIVGAGGLGSPVAYYLAAAGVGKIILCDKDVVDTTNLNRQILHFTPDVDKSKASSAANKLTELNPEISIETHHVNVDRKVLDMLASEADILVDCLDNVPTRLLLNEYCIEKQTPLMHAGIDCWTAQMTLVNPPKTPCLRCLFDDFEESGKPKPVLGAVAGIMGTSQALAVLKYLAGINTGLENKLLYFDALSMEWSSLPISKNDNCIICS